MPPILELLLLFIIGLVAPILLFRWLLRKYVGSDEGTLDRVEGYARGWGDAHWQQLNNRQQGEAEKPKHSHAFEGARIRAEPSPMHMPQPSRLSVSEDADPIPLSDLLPDLLLDEDSQQNRQ
ncbi:MAG: hypothetical protein Q9P01_04485 [Anaerolineae bacterium]|nr:hypothetical protein [Anaerolineae bacterium]MDQ7034100.1 hypothetical protein [Anaerolineae bacterium]